jgi:hypothetical protein
MGFSLPKNSAIKWTNASNSVPKLVIEPKLSRLPEEPNIKNIFSKLKGRELTVRKLMDGWSQREEVFMFHGVKGTYP